MKKYFKPFIEEEIIELDDIIANSNISDEGDDEEYSSGQ